MRTSTHDARARAYFGENGCAGLLWSRENPDFIHARACARRDPGQIGDELRALGKTLAFLNSAEAQTSCLRVYDRAYWVTNGQPPCCDLAAETRQTPFIGARACEPTAETRCGPLGNLGVLDGAKFARGHGTRACALRRRIIRRQHFPADFQHSIAFSRLAVILPFRLTVNLP